MTELEKSLLPELRAAKTDEEIRGVVMKLPAGEQEPEIETDAPLSSTAEPPTTLPPST